jgi:hypothetical protein
MQGFGEDYTGAAVTRPGELLLHLFPIDGSSPSLV